jgi:GH35 family endo-1,4-beta-xylanase
MNFNTTFLIFKKAVTLALVLLLMSAYIKAETPEQWYANAQQRIDTLRKGAFHFKVVDRNGIAIQDSVKVLHKKHEFPWGTAIDLDYTSNTTFNSYTTSQTVTAEKDAEIYKSERWASYIVYKLPAVKNVKYKITIKLAEIYLTAANSRLFDVFVNEQKVMENVDKFLLAKGQNKAFDTTINVIATDTLIRLGFQAIKDNASIMGIVLSDSLGNAILRLNCGGGALTTSNNNKYLDDLAYIDKDAVSPSTTKNDWMKAIMLKYCNYGVCGNQFKWSGIEATHGQLNYAPFENTLHWFQKVGWDMRAHTLLWGGTSSTDYHELPQWVGVLPPKQMFDTCKMRVTREVSRYKGIVKEYDVMNEASSNHATYLQSKVGDSINWYCFKWARAADPNAKLFINDYNIIEYQDQTDNFVNMVKKMLANGAPVTGIGAQCHIGANVDIPNYKKRFDQLGQFGFPVKVTEFDMGAGAVSQQVQATETAKFMRLCFSHPSIEGFIFWGLMDPGWAKGVENLINEDKTPRIVADTAYHLIHEVWTTKLSGTTDATGSFTFTGYYGDYDILVKIGSKWKKFSVPYKKVYKDSVFVLNESKSNVVSPVLKKVRNISSTNIELTFDKAMSDPSSEKNFFKVFDISTNYVKSAALKSSDSTTIVLTTNSPFKPKNYIPVSYYPGGITSFDGGQLETFGPTLDQTLTTAYLSSTTITNGKKLSVSFNGKISDTSVHASNFIVKVNNILNNVTAVAVNAKKDSVYLTLSDQVISSTATVTLSYQPGTLATENGQFVTGFENKAVTNVVVMPKFVTSVTGTDGKTVQVNFDQLLDETTLKSTDFTITVNNKNNQVKGAVLLTTNKRYVVLTLESTLNYNDTVNVTYKAGSLVTNIGVPITGFSAKVTNNVKVAIESGLAKNTEIYPNPFSEKFVISNTNDFELATINDLDGKKILQIQLKKNGSTEINTSDLASGMYIVVLSNSTSQSVFKVVKK